MDETWKRIVRWGIMAIGAILTAIVAAVLVVQIPPIQQAVLEDITASTNEQLAGEMTVDSVRGPILWRLTLDDVQIRDARGTPVAHVDKMRVGYSLLDVLWGDVEVERLGLIRPLVLVRMLPDETYNIFGVTEPGPSSEERFAISSLTIEEGAILYDNPPDVPFVRGLEGVRADVDAWLDEAFATGGSFETDTMRTLLGPRHGGEAVGIALADDVEVEAELALGPGDRQMLRVDAFSTTVYRPSFWELLPLSGEEILVDMTPEQWRVEVDEMAFSKGANLEALALELVPEGDETIPPSDASAFRTVDGRLGSFVVTPAFLEVFTLAPPLAIPVQFGAAFEGPSEEVAVTASGTTDEGGDIRVEGAVDATVPAYDLDFEFEHFRLAEWIAAEVPTLAFHAEGSVTGEGLSYGEHLEADLEMSGSEIRVGTMKANRLELDASARGRRLELSDLTVAAPMFGLKTEGYRTPEGDIVASSVVETADRAAAARLAEYLRIDPALLGRGELEMVLGQGSAFELGLQLIPTIAPQLPFFFRTEGTHGDELASLTLTSADVGRPGWTWTLEDRARVALRDEEIAISSMVLKHREQSVRLDGIYDLRDAGALATMLDDITPGPLDVLFDVEALRGRFPEKLLDKPVEQLREKIPDELEKRLPGELEKRLPGELKDFLSP